MSPAEQLAQGLGALGLDVDAPTQQKLLDYAALISKWNRVHNLTAVSRADAIVTTHLLDSLAMAPHLSPGPTLDVGSGAGLPGIPLALLWPRAHVTLLDRSRKKAAFLRQAAIELALDNVEVVGERIENWRTAQRYATVIARAYSGLAEFVKAAARYCSDGGLLAAMKGAYPRAELAALPVGFEVQKVIALNVPGLRAERHLVLVKAGA
jgi:16S rRNA (guanine527-N7)-methyltransferase